MDKYESRYEQIKDQAFKFHAEHPEVWDMFKRFAFSRIQMGYQHYSATAIFYRIRWEKERPTYEKGKEFKLCSQFSAFYSRWFMDTFPQYDGFFFTRKQKSKDRPPYYGPELTPEDMEEDPERSEYVLPDEDYYDEA